MASELERGEGLKTSPFFGREIGQYHVQTVNFRASKKAPSIADIKISSISYRQALVPGTKDWFDLPAVDPREAMIIIEWKQCHLRPLSGVHLRKKRIIV